MSQSNDNTVRVKWKHISEKERYKIEALRKEKHTTREIAAQLGRH
ncbi:MAG: helix-turn-helix domain-containing protein [Syntrophomonadaceae bacterium]|jgi:IS30 family transposase|nr:helix-turn-helix domain-containing protein [Syntrophomonadaceae bacterium]